jgi:hypothetical protein
MFLGPSDPLVTSKDPDSDHSSSSKYSKKNLDFYCFMTFYQCSGSVRYVSGPPPDPHTNPLDRGTDPRTRIASGTVPKCHGSTTLFPPPF